MEKIESFKVNHKTLVPGIYVSREDGKTTTYDIRLVKPNSYPILSTSILHTIEHLAATYMRNSKYKNHIIYFGPMGCRTGCYFISDDGLLFTEAIQLIKETFTFISHYTGEIPGSKEEECGNYLDHDLEGARKVAEEFSKTVWDWTLNDLTYPD